MEKTVSSKIDSATELNTHPLISICILTHNAPRYVWTTLKTLYRQRENRSTYRTETIVVDNKSKWPTRLLLKLCKFLKYVDILIFNPKNSFFAGGNNIAVSHANNNAQFILLLNSDVEIKSPHWLSSLLSFMQPNVGAVSYGACRNEPIRADGYCILLRKEMYDKYGMNEDFQWFWSMTQLESNILCEGFDIIAIEDHEKMIHHFGGKSGDAWKTAAGMDVDMAEVIQWFNSGSGSVRILEKI